MAKKRVDVVPGEVYVGEMPSSEVCMHMQIAGKTMKFMLLAGEGRYPAVQILNDDLTPYSAPVTTGEGGLYHDGTPSQFVDGESFYYYVEE